jgi:hypothetical protein
MIGEPLVYVLDKILMVDIEPRWRMVEDLIYFICKGRFS